MACLANIILLCQASTVQHSAYHEPVLSGGRWLGGVNCLNYFFCVESGVVVVVSSKEGVRKAELLHFSSKILSYLPA